MPRAPKPLPHRLDDIFTRDDALEHGLTIGRLRRTDLDKRVRGVRAAAGASDDLATRCRMWQRRLGPAVFFSHTTAALLAGAPLPVHYGSGDVHATVPTPMRAPHANGLVGHSRFVAPGDVRIEAGVRRSSPARLWCELGMTLSVPDLVAVADALIQRRAPVTTRAELAERLDVGDRIARSRRLRVALSLLDDRAESAQESRLRVLLALGGLPTPDVNHTLVATDGGHDLRPDFLFWRERVALEYQGDYHRTQKQWRDDMTRRTRLEADGWRVVELNADDLKNPRELCDRIRRLLARGPR